MDSEQNAGVGPKSEARLESVLTMSRFAPKRPTRAGQAARESNEDDPGPPKHVRRAQFPRATAEPDPPEAQGPWPSPEVSTGGHESCEVDVKVLERSSAATALTSDPIMKTSAVLETSDQELSNERSAAEIRQATEEQ